MNFCAQKGVVLKATLLLVVELERIRAPVVVVSHVSTLQVLYAYFRAIPVADAPDVDIPLNTVIDFTPHQYGWIERRLEFVA